MVKQAGPGEEGIVGKNARKTEFYSIWRNHCHNITVLALSLVNKKIQKISLTEKLTVWHHIGTQFLSVCLLIDDNFTEQETDLLL